MIVSTCRTPFDPDIFGKIHRNSHRVCLSSSFRRNTVSSTLPCHADSFRTDTFSKGRKQTIFLKWMGKTFLNL